MTLSASNRPFIPPSVPRFYKLGRSEAAGARPSGFQSLLQVLHRLFEILNAELQPVHRPADLADQGGLLLRRHVLPTLVIIGHAWWLHAAPRFLQNPVHVPRAAPK